MGAEFTRTRGLSTVIASLFRPTMGAELVSGRNCLGAL